MIFHVDKHTWIRPDTSPEETIRLQIIRPTTD